MMKNKQLICAVFMCILTLAFAMPAFAAGALVIDNMAKLSGGDLAELDGLAKTISEARGMDIGFFLPTNDYAADGQTLSGYVRERYSGMENGFVLAHDIDGKIWTLVSFGTARQAMTEEIEDQLWAAYDTEETYYYGIMAYLDAAGDFAAQAASPGLPGPIASILERDSNSFALLADEAGLLSEDEADALLKKLTDLSAQWKNDIVIVTVDSIDGATPEAFADDWFDYGGYGQGEDFDGVLLLLNMGERDWRISACGYSITAFTDAGIEFLGQRLKADGLSDEGYAAAFNGFADWCGKFFEQAATGQPYDTGNMPVLHKTSAEYIAVIAVCFGAGLIIALFVTKGMKKKLTSVRKNSRAADYVRPGSLQVLYQNEQFLFRNTTRTKAAESSGGGGGGSSTHKSSSGTSHGGGGGKF